MKMRGNFKLFFVLEMIAGITTFILCYLFGDIGLLGLAIFFTGLILTVNPKADERELQLVYKASSMEYFVMGAVMGLVYFLELPFNWFHVFISAGAFIRGAFGLYFFSKE